MSRAAAVLTALFVLTTAGLVHGIWAERWHPSEELRAACARVEQVPSGIGDWTATPEEADGASFAQAGAQSYWVRAYTHPRKKTTLYVILMCGRSGKMAVHTPEVCYRGAGLEIADRPETWAVSAAAGASLGTFWTASFTKDAGADLRLVWGWNAGDGWQAPSNPRWNFGGQPYLYKLYLSYELTPGSERAAEDFMRQFLPQLEKTLARRS